MWMIITIKHEISQFGPWNLMIATTIDEKTKQVDDYLIFDGGISEGISTILNETLHKNPNIKTLVLNSRGGNPDEVLQYIK